MASPSSLTTSKIIAHLCEVIFFRRIQNEKNCSKICPTTFRQRSVDRRVEVYPSFPYKKNIEFEAMWSFIVIFWNVCGRKWGANILKSDIAKDDFCIKLACCPALPLYVRHCSMFFFSVHTNEIPAERMPFWYCRRNTSAIARCSKRPNFLQCFESWQGCWNWPTDEKGYYF